MASKWYSPLLLLATAASAQAQLGKHEQVLPPLIDKVKIKAPPPVTSDLVNEIVKYEGGVTLEYGPTLITADAATIYYAQGYAEVTGNVVVTDPEGTIFAQHLRFSWQEHTGHADNVTVELGNATVKAAALDIFPDRWELTDATATNCKRPLPFYMVRSRKVVLYPGKKAVAQRPKIFVLGKEIVTLPNRTFSLDRRDPGLQYPTIGYKKNGTLGVTWASGLLLDDQTLFSGSMSAFPGRPVGINLVVAHSWIPAKVTQAPIPPRNDLGERFTNAYFDNVNVDSRSSEERSLHTPRASVSIGSIFGGKGTGRLDEESYAKPFDIAGEKSFRLGGWAGIGQVRLQAIRQASDATHIRSTSAIALLPPSLDLGHGFYGVARFDASSFVASSSVYAWVRAQSGILYNPSKTLSLGAVYVDSLDVGRSMFPIDELTSKEGLQLRGDLNLGGTRLSYLVKSDARAHKWYDREYKVSQAIGCVEAFLTYRQFPSQYALGIRLRADDLFDALRRRDPRRTKPVPNTEKGK